MKHLALAALSGLAPLVTCCKGELIGKATKESALEAVPAQVQVSGHIAGRPFNGGTIFVMPEVGDPTLIKTVIYSDRSKVRLVCRQLSDSLPSDFYYDHVTIWVKAATGTYQVTSDDKAQAKVLIENYATEGAPGPLSSFAEPTGTAKMAKLSGGELEIQLDIHGNPDSLKDNPSLNDFRLSGSFKAPVCRSN